MDSLDGRVALVTGGSRGIGAAVCAALGAAGADVCVNYSRSQEAADEVVEALRACGRRAIAIGADVASVAECRRLVDESVAAMGGLDIVVNNAGGGFGKYVPFEEVTESLYDFIMNVNLKGTFFTAQAAAPHLRARGRGRIINTASELLFIGYELMTAYTASKGGVVALTRSMARALAPNINVNVVAPGPTATERVKQERWFQEEAEEHLAELPLRRFGTPEEVARSVVFLAGPGGDWITGQTINVNGGAVMP